MENKKVIFWEIHDDTINLSWIINNENNFETKPIEKIEEEYLEKINIKKIFYYWIAFIIFIFILSFFITNKTNWNKIEEMRQEILNTQSWKLSESNKRLKDLENKLTIEYDYNNKILNCIKWNSKVATVVDCNYSSWSLDINK